MRGGRIARVGDHQAAETISRAARVLDVAAEVAVMRSHDIGASITIDIGKEGLPPAPCVVGGGIAARELHERRAARLHSRWEPGKTSRGPILVAITERDRLQAGTARVGVGSKLLDG